MNTVGASKLQGKEVLRPTRVATKTVGAGRSALALPLTVGWPQVPEDVQQQIIDAFCGVVEAQPSPSPKQRPHGIRKKRKKLKTASSRKKKRTDTPAEADDNPSQSAVVASDTTHEGTLPDDRDDAKVSVVQEHDEVDAASLERDSQPADASTGDTEGRPSVEPVGMRWPGLVIGVNAITRCLEKQVPKPTPGPTGKTSVEGAPPLVAPPTIPPSPRVVAVLASADVQPTSLISHLPFLTSAARIPLLVAPGLNERASRSLGMKSVLAVGLTELPISPYQSVIEMMRAELPITTVSFLARS